MNNYGGVPDFRSSQDQEAGSDQPSHDPGGPLISELLWDKGPVPFAAQTPLFVPEGELSAWLSSPDDVTAAFAADSGLYPLPSGEGSLPPLPPPVPLRLCASEGSPMVQSAVTAAATAMAAPRLEERERERKRKAAPSCESDSRTSEDVEEGSDEKERSSSKSSRKTRSAEVHNSSERRRRDRINEKMKALRELLPRTSKLDKASMLDDAIEYTKSLQRQLQQMMSMGCTTFPMMYPAMQQYFPSMAAASIPMRADTGAGQLGHPMIPFFPGVQGSAPAGSASYSSMLPFQATYPYPTLFSGQQRAQGINFSNQVSDTTSSQCLNQPHLLNFPDSSYRQYFGHWHPNLQMPCEQNQEPTKTKTYEEKELPGNSNG